MENGFYSFVSLRIYNKITDRYNKYHGGAGEPRAGNDTLTWFLQVGE